MMWRNVGRKHPTTEHSNGHRNGVDVKNPRELRRNCGALFGILPLLGTISVIAYYKLVSKRNFAAELFLLAAEGIMYLYGIVLMLYSVILLRIFRIDKWISADIQLNVSLLSMSVVGVFTFAMLGSVGGYINAQITPLLLIMSLSMLVHATMQSFMIVWMFDRRVGSAEDARKKNGNDVFSLLIGNNAALWLFQIFKTYDLKVDHVIPQFMSLAHSVLSRHAAMPLVSYFYLHCVLCLIVTRTIAYKYRHSRLTR